MQNNASNYPLISQQYLQKYEKRISLRKLNFDKEDQDQQFISINKTAAIKTIQKFIAKFKIDNKNHQSILQEIDTLNLSKYTDQIANIIVNSLTEKDIEFYTQIATKLNKQYNNFPSIIIEYLKKAFVTLWESPQDNRSKLKAIVIFTTELFVCGFTFSYKEIREMLIKIFKSGNKKKNNITNQKEKRLFAFYYNSQCFVQFLINYWEQFTKLTPKWIEEWKEQGINIKQFPQTVPLAQREELTKFFTKYVSECEAVLIQNIELLKTYENQLKENLRMQGEFNKENEKKYSGLISKFNITKQNLRLIRQAVNEPSIDQNLNYQIRDLNQIMKSYVNTDGDAQIFDNQFEKQIYENLPEFTKEQQKSTDTDYKLFKQRLEKCKNVHDSNTLAKQFQKYNNKKNRKNLIRDILEYRKQYYIVAPYFCRIAAIVNQSFKDVNEIIVDNLFTEYDKLKENVGTAFIVTDKKNRNWKYLCEFTKFNIIDAQRIITCLHELIEDLKGQNIELLIFALQNLGRFLYLSPSTANKFTFMLNKLDNVLKQKSFPLLTTARLTNAMTKIKPVVQTEVKVQKIISPEDTEALEILSYDVTQDLSEMIRKVKKFIGKGKQYLESFNQNLMERILEYNFIGNYNYAFLLSDLNNEDVISFVLENNSKLLFSFLKVYEYQKGMILSRFLGELYKYQLLKKSALYQILEDLLMFEGNQLGVINAVCTILQTCVGYLDNKKLASQNAKFKFLYSFRKYITKCKYVPMMQEFKVTDIFEVYQEKYLCSISIEYVNEFMLTSEGKKDKEGKDINLSKQFDKYLEKKNLKEKLVEVQLEKNQLEQRIKQNMKFIDEDEEQEKKSSLELLKSQAKFFENQFNQILTSNIKDFSGRIAKTTFLEKAIDKKKEKKKGENEKIISVIGRSGNRFVRKDISVKEQNVFKRDQEKN